MSQEKESSKNSRSKRVAVWAIVGGIFLGIEGVLAGAALGLIWPLDTRKQN